MKRGDVVPIFVAGQRLEAEYVGAGRYATAYRHRDDVYLFVVGDTMKEALSETPPGPHIPRCEYVEAQDRRGSTEPVRVFRTAYSRTLGADCREAWGQYRALQRAHDQACRDIEQRVEARGERWGVFSQYGPEISERAIEIADVPEDLRDALSRLLNSGNNYSHGVCFEFARRNLGVDGEGRLVLRDALIDCERRERELSLARTRERSRDLSEERYAYVGG